MRINQFNLWINSNYTVIQSIISFMDVIFLGIYLDLFIKRIENYTVTEIWNTFLELGALNIILFVGLAFILVNNYLLSIPPAVLKNVGRKTINNMLEAACLSLTYSMKSTNIRAIITLINRSREDRTTQFSYNIKPDPERTATFPVDFGVTGKAILSKMVIIEELSEDHTDDYAAEIKPLILPELKWVIAAPIYLPDNIEKGPVGVLAFDGIDPLPEKFNERRIKDVVQTWSDFVADIITQAKVIKLHTHKKKN